MSFQTVTYSVAYSVYNEGKCGFASSRRGVEKNGPWTQSRFEELARVEAGTDADTMAVLYVSRPTNANVKGIDQPVPVVALRRTLSDVPVQEVSYSPSQSNDVDNLVDDAEDLLPKAGNRAQAHKMLLDAIKKEPRCARAHFLCGVVNRLDGEHAAAMDCFMAALEADPSSGMAWKLVGLTALHDCLVNHGDIDLAIGALSQARDRAWSAYDFDMERCCHAFLAFAYSVRGGQGDQDLARVNAKDFLNQVPVSDLHVFMSKVLCVLLNPNDLAVCSAALTDAVKLVGGLDKVDDSLLDVRDLKKMLAHAEYFHKLSVIG